MILLQGLNDCSISYFQRVCGARQQDTRGSCWNSNPRAQQNDNSDSERSPRTKAKLKKTTSRTLPVGFIPGGIGSLSITFMTIALIVFGIALLALNDGSLLETIIALAVIGVGVVGFLSTRGLLHRRRQTAY